MQNHHSTWRALRALQLATLALAAAVAFVLLTASGAGAQVTISNTDIAISNSGEAEATTGNNDLVANDSEESVVNEQVAEPEDGVLHNESEESSESDGSATLETGSATAFGNIAGTVVVQATATGTAADKIIADAIGTPYGPQPTSPLVAIDEALPSEDTSEPAESTGSDEDAGLEVDEEGEDPEGDEPESDLEATEATASSGSNEAPTSALPFSGTSAIDAGAPVVPVLATPPLDNSVLGAVSGAGPPGVTITDQRSDVENEGEATATTGENTVVDGDVLTGNATATGNISETSVSQLIVAAGDLNLIDQATDISNEGEAVADTGDNEIEGGDLETGDADAAGSISANASSQLAVAIGDLNLIDQAIGMDNEGEGVAETGENVVEDGEVATGDATATGNWSGSALGQRVISPQDDDQTDVEQDLEAENEGDALADTGDNEAVAGEDGEVVISTGSAAAFGNIAALATGQEA